MFPPDTSRVSVIMWRYLQIRGRDRKEQNRSVRLCSPITDSCKCMICWHGFNQSLLSTDVPLPSFAWCIAVCHIILSRKLLPKEAAFLVRIFHVFLWRCSKLELHFTRNAGWIDSMALNFMNVVPFWLESNATELSCFGMKVPVIARSRSS